MVHVTRTFAVATAPEQTQAYIADFSNAVDWDPGTQRCDRRGSGPIEVGARWHNVSKVLGRETSLEYRLEKLDPGHVVLVGSNKTATSTDDITIKPAGAGSEITYSATIELNGLAKLAAPVMKIAMEKLGDGTVDGLQAALGKG